MEQHLLVVLTNAVEGRDDEFNEWYTNHHLQAVVGLDGFSCATRFQILNRSAPYRYLAIYEVPEGRIDTAKAALKAADPTPEMASPFLGDAMTYWCTAISETVVE